MRAKRVKTFIVRQREEYGRTLWQVGQDVCGDASYYNGDTARRWFDKFVKRGMTPIFEDGAIEPVTH